MPRTTIVPRTVAVRDPFQDMRQLMRRAFDDVPAWFDDLATVAAPAARGQTLPLDVFESADGLAVEASLPGVAPDDVEVTLEKGKLSIRAEKAAPEGDAADEGRTFFLRERHHGPHARSILIGDGYDPDSVAGSLKDGVLTIRVRKAAQAQPRQVAITSA
jgi:HSP20 family protein